MRRNAVMGAGLVLVALAVVVTDARAQGYGVYEHDACVMGRSGTGVAAPCSGASAVFFNPAGIVASGPRTNVTIGATIIAPRNTFVDSLTGLTTDGVGNNIPVPALFVTRQINERWAIGIGVFAPYGLVSEWPEATFEGRFLAYRSELKAIYIQPTAAYRLRPNLRIGAGLTYVMASADLKQRVDLAGQALPTGGTFAQLGIAPGTDFANAGLEGTSRSMAAHFGVIWDVNARLSFGARYMMRQTADISGEAKFTQINTGLILGAGNPLGAPGGTPLDAVLAAQFTGSGSLTTQKGYVNVPMPDQLVVGVSLMARQNLRLLFDYQWVNWSEFTTLEINFAKLGRRTLFEDYMDTHGYRVGVDWQVTPRAALRGGALYHTHAAPAQTVTPLLPEGARMEGTLGLGYQMNGRLRLDLAYQRIAQEDRRGRVRETTVRGPGGAAVNTGLFTGTANLFGASLAYGF